MYNKLHMAWSPYRLMRAINNDKEKHSKWQILTEPSLT